MFHLQYNFNMKKNLLILFLCVFFVLPVFHRAEAAADPLRPFGGIVAFWLPCTCSMNFIVYLVPPHPVLYPWVTHSLIYQPLVTIPYPFEEFIGEPTAWQLGKFLPGGGQCLMLAPDPIDPCIPIPSDGMAVGPLGSSYPGYVF